MMHRLVCAGPKRSTISISRHGVCWMDLLNVNATNCPLHSAEVGGGCGDWRGHMEARLRDFYCPVPITLRDFDGIHPTLRAPAPICTLSPKHFSTFLDCVMLMQS